MTTQTEAERLADALQAEFAEHRDEYKAAAELRRLVSFNNDLMDEVARLQKREWVGLTEDEFDDLRDNNFGVSPLISAVEAKLKEKNERKEKNQ